MPSVHDQLSEQYTAFNIAGRGWKVFSEPVRPEPPFRPFRGYELAAVVDDGRRTTIGSSLVASFSRWLANPVPQSVPSAREVEEETEPKPLLRNDLVELQTTLPAKLNIPRETLAGVLSNLALCIEPVTFELVANSDQVLAQFVAHQKDAPLVRRQLVAYFPEATFISTKGALDSLRDEESYHAVVEFGLNRDFLYPLAQGKIDPFIGLIGALSELNDDEGALFQVIFEPCESGWRENIVRSVTDPTGKALFVNRPEFAGLASEKTAEPLYAAVVRIMAKSEDIDRTWEILRDMAGALRVFANPNGNELIPLTNDEYPFEDHLEDVFRRQTRRSGMILTLDELIGFVHLPSATVRTEKFLRQVSNTKAAPSIVTESNGLILGENVHAGESQLVRLSPEQRTRHIHVIGASGTGKSTFLLNLINQDVAAGEGLAVLDPHGDLIDRILGIIPEHRIKDVVLVDPSDETASIGFNILSAHSDLEKTLLASDLVSVFQRLSQSWGDQMESVLRNAILAFLESSKGGTLSDLRRFLLDSAYREKFLTTIEDPDIQFYWRKGFSQLSGNKSIGPVLTRLETFLSPKPLRYMVAQAKNRLDFPTILDSGKILLAKLSQGGIGKENSYILGSLLMAKLQQTAMSRQRQATGARRDFWVYVDEFQNFITPSIGEILSGARKYRVGLVLAHQELRHLDRDRDVASAVLSNPYTRVVFRVGDADAKALESGFSTFEAHDLQNLGTGEAIARVDRSTFDFNLAIPLPEEPDADVAAERTKEVIAYSRNAYATPRAEVEVELRRRFESESESPKESLPKKSPPVVEKVPEPEPDTPRVIILPYAPAPLASVSEPPKVVPASPKEPADLGRGGEQHKSIQKRIKAAAEKLGYLVTTEKPVLNKTGSVDLALESSERRIAVEITITTTIDHEVGNVTKCLRAEFHLVAVISSSETKLRQMKEAVSAAVGPELFARVGFFLPDAFIEHLNGFPKTDSKTTTPQHTETKRRGYTVKRSAPKLTAEELKAKEDAAMHMLAETMKQKPKGTNE